ncbi:AsnC family protein [Streptomyces sp. NPDC006660]
MTGNPGNVDWALIHQLRQGAFICLSELGRRVGLGSSATTERVRHVAG